ncbi:hypothetical protein GCM10010384_07500 [Streptomyces djakartensis]|uniref:Beta-galactosidase n=1 Tax=Streptomyces djakartensis TaxID=68193 RepID=A0ABQ2ZA00_9ACTN|nr:hypothetical protein GCM10010384_07500 [Streptomyces djakartensis]
MPGRRTVALRDGWRFALVNPGGTTDAGGGYADVRLPGYDYSGWREIAVPHDWSIEQAPHPRHHQRHRFPPRRSRLVPPRLRVRVSSQTSTR